MRGRAVRTAGLAGGGAEAARLTRCAGTWLEREPDGAEQRRIAEAQRLLSQQRSASAALHADPEAANAFCIELFRGEVYRPLHLSDELVAQMIAREGEPPVVAEGDEAEFSDYLRRAVLAVAQPNARRLLAAQLRRYLPQYVEAGQWREAAAIDYSAFRTSLGNEVTPFLAQMALAGLADYYEAHDDGEDGRQP
jgi:hypothetical protein